MKHISHSCDIKSDVHGGAINEYKVPVMFDHDQEDGKSKTKPYFEMQELDLCREHYNRVTEERQLIYAHGAMGYNTYTI